jgi:hypothetical protein
MEKVLKVSSAFVYNILFGEIFATKTFTVRFHKFLVVSGNFVAKYFQKKTLKKTAFFNAIMHRAMIKSQAIMLQPLKGLSHEIDFKNFDPNLQNLA